MVVIVEFILSLFRASHPIYKYIPAIIIKPSDILLSILTPFAECINFLIKFAPNTKIETPLNPATIVKIKITANFMVVRFYKSIKFR